MNTRFVVGYCARLDFVGKRAQEDSLHIDLGGDYESFCFDWLPKPS